MATIHEYRQKIDHKLDRLELEATALEEELNQTREQAIQKHERLKKSLQAALVKVQEKLKSYKNLTEDQVRQLKTKFEELQVDLALGKADTVQKIKEEKQKTMTHLNELEHKIDQFLKEKSTELTEQMLQASDKLDADFIAMEVSFNMQSQKAKENLRNKKEELLKQIRVFKRKLVEIRESDIQKSSQFDQEFTQGLKAIKNAFIHLME